MDRDDDLNSLLASTRLPPEEQTAWQRWELASFGDNRPTAIVRAEAEKAARTALGKQLAQQIADSRECARAEGHAQGYQEGCAAGHEQGLVQGRAEAIAEREQLSQLAGGFTEALSQANEAIAQDLLTLALDIAKAIVKTALTSRPELLLPLVSELMRETPATHTPATLVLQPDDARLVHTHLGELLSAGQWQIRHDAEMARGGCRIETAGRQIDADISVRWLRVAQTLGRDIAWID